MKNIRYAKKVIESNITRDLTHFSSNPESYRLSILCTVDTKMEWVGIPVLLGILTYDDTEWSLSRTYLCLDPLILSNQWNGYVAAPHASVPACAKDLNQAFLSDCSKVLARRQITSRKKLTCLAAIYVQLTIPVFWCSVRHLNHFATQG